MRNELVRAMLLMMFAMLILPGMDAIAKWLSGSVSAGQIALARFAFQTLFMLPLLYFTSGKWITSNTLLRWCLSLKTITSTHLTPRFYSWMFQHPGDLYGC